jgi:hypothetical protein
VQEHQTNGGIEENKEIVKSVSSPIETSFAS